MSGDPGIDRTPGNYQRGWTSDWSTFTYSGSPGLNVVTEAFNTATCSMSNGLLLTGTPKRFVVSTDGLYQFQYRCRWTPAAGHPGESNTLAAVMTVDNVGTSIWETDHTEQNGNREFEFLATLYLGAGQEIGLSLYATGNFVPSVSIVGAIARIR